MQGASCCLLSFPFFSSKPLNCKQKPCDQPQKKYVQICELNDLETKERQLQLACKHQGVLAWALVNQIYTDLFIWCLAKLF